MSLQLFISRTPPVTVRVQVGNYLAVLVRESSGRIVFDRFYKGEGESVKTNVFDNKPDGLQNRSTSPVNVANMVFWCCIGRQCNSFENEVLRHQMAAIFNY